MAKHIGIVAVSAEGAALCYRTICSEGAGLIGRHNHPEITMHTYPLARYMQSIDADDWHAVATLLLSSAERVRRAGAEFVICPDNTVHQAIDRVREQSPLPWCHIADEVASVASESGYKHLLVLGTRCLMEGPVYASTLAARGIEHQTPALAERQRINDCIFEELVCGRVLDASRTYLRDVISGGRENGADAVVLGCTELPLLVDATDSALPLLDSTRILARAALREALG